MPVVNSAIGCFKSYSWSGQFKQTLIMNSEWPNALTQLAACIILIKVVSLHIRNTHIMLFKVPIMLCSNSHHQANYGMFTVWYLLCSQFINSFKNLQSSIIYNEREKCMRQLFQYTCNYSRDKNNVLQLLHSLININIDAL